MDQFWFCPRHKILEGGCKNKVMNIFIVMFLKVVWCVSKREEIDRAFSLSSFWRWGAGGAAGGICWFWRDGVRWWAGQAGSSSTSPQSERRTVSAELFVSAFLKSLLQKTQKKYKSVYHNSRRGPAAKLASQQASASEPASQRASSSSSRRAVQQQSSSPAAERGFQNQSEHIYCPDLESCVMMCEQTWGNRKSFLAFFLMKMGGRSVLCKVYVYILYNCVWILYNIV